jgi:octaprenyl-diphosphate synthase
MFKLAILITESVKELVKDNNGLYTESKMVEFQQEALLLLDNYSNSDFKEALILMVNLLKEK